MRVIASTEDLPREVAAALAHPDQAGAGALDATGRRWTFLSWGDAAHPPLLLVHGVTSNAGTWWRIGPALAAARRRVIAVDMPGHGADPSWQGRYRLADTAEDLAGFIRAADIDVGDLAVVGHSWGAAVSAHLPHVGMRPAVLVLLDPPFLPVRQMEELTNDPTDHRYATQAEAASAIRAASPTWSDGDVEAKARALTEFNEGAVLDVVVRNGDWDAGMAALRQREAAGIPIWLIRGDEETGGLIPDPRVPEIEAQLGADHVMTIAGGPHSPHRTHPEATVLAILRALRSAA